MFRINKRNLEFVKNSICVGEVSLEEKLFDDSEVVTGFGESQKYLLHVIFHLFLNQMS